MHARMRLDWFLVASIFVVCSSIVQADLNTYTKAWPIELDEDVPVIDNTVNLDNSADLAIVENQERIKENNRLYFKFAVNASRAEIRQIRNLSSAPLAALRLNHSGLVTNNFTWEFGFGSKIDMTRYELEYIHYKKLNYNAAPVFLGNAASLGSEIMNRSLLVNMCYDFDNFVYVKPYIGGIIGVVWHKVRSQVTGLNISAAKTYSRYGLAWGGKIGARLPFWSNWFADLGYRYTGQGKVYWKDRTGTLYMYGRYVFSGFYLGLNYIV